jgi:maltodextrin utilization protein YvdJ
MTTQELRNHEEYALAMKKIRSYRKGFEFTLNYSAIPRPQANALKIIMQDAIEMGLIESIAIGLALDGTQTDETYRKIKERNI